MDTLLTLLGTAGCHFIMGVPGAAAIMLSDPSTSFHAGHNLRQLPGLGPAPEFAAWPGLILLGERPGLDSADSPGAYFTGEPGTGCTDPERNCLSNIRPGGPAPEHAAERLSGLLTESRRRRLSGTGLMDEAPLPTLQGRSD